jgi:hypothetical protein
MKKSLDMVLAEVRERTPELASKLVKKDGVLYVVADGRETFRHRRRLAYDEGRGIGFQFRPEGWELTVNGQKVTAYWRHSCDTVTGGTRKVVSVTPSVDIRAAASPKPAPKPATSEPVAIDSLMQSILNSIQ